MHAYIGHMIRYIAPFASVVVLGLATPALAQDPAEMAKIDILPGWQMANGHRMAAIRVQLAPGWHTYWRTPGETGIPPTFELSGSDNLARMDLHWPAPKLFADNGMWYLGYENELILPVELIPEASGDIHLSGTMDLGVCNDICVPMQAMLDAKLSPESVGPARKEIESALADQPKKIIKATCKAAPISDGMRVSVDMSVPQLGPYEVAVIEHPDRSVWVSEAHVARAGNKIKVASDLVPSDAQPFFIDRSQLTITVIGGDTAYEADGCSGE
ncbi:protein-disulfide reductase DsbD domain-containing protein [Celeribacter sp. ULVN23_4]